MMTYNEIVLMESSSKNNNDGNDNNKEIKKDLSAKQQFWITL